MSLSLKIKVLSKREPISIVEISLDAFQRQRRRGSRGAALQLATIPAALWASLRPIRNTKATASSA